MTWADVEAVARFGTEVRRASWPTTKRLTFVAGGGTSREVAVMRNGSVETVLTTEDFGVVEQTADDWRPVVY